MSYKNEIFTARLDEVMQKDDRALPLLPGALNDLKALLSDDGDYTFASIRSDAKYEAVKIMNVDGLLVVDRGIEGTEPLRHPYGSCITLVQPALIAVVKDLICSYDCCSDKPCECRPAAVASVAMPDVESGQYWHGSVGFTGDQPMTIAIDIGDNDWITAKQDANLVYFEGLAPSMIPVAADTYENVMPLRVSVSVAATNCNGHVALVQPTFYIYPPKYKKAE